MDLKTEQRLIVMESKINIDGASVEVMMSGKLTVNDHERFRDFLAEDVVKGKKSVILDLSSIDFIDSAGIGMLLYANSKSQAEPWDLIIRKPQGQVLKLIELGRLDEVLTVLK